MPNFSERVSCFLPSEQIKERVNFNNTILKANCHPKQIVDKWGIND